MSQANLLLLLAVFLPPAVLDIFGELVEECTVQTPYGPVGPLALRALPNGPAVWVQPYTGFSHRTDPRATILAARQLGLRQVLNWDNGIGLNPLLHRGQTVIVTDYIDWTRDQPTTFTSGDREQNGEPTIFVPRSPQWDTPQSPFCRHMVGALHAALPQSVGVTYLGVDGPRRETEAEARMFRMWGVDIIGQNLVPEVSLAREAQLCYAGLVTVTDLSADQPKEIPHGEVRVALGRTIEALPAVVQAMEAPEECACGA